MKILRNKKNGEIKENARKLEVAGVCGMFWMLGVGVENVLQNLGLWIEEVRQDVCNVQSDVAALQDEAGQMRKDLDRLCAEVAHMKRREQFRELAAQEAKLVFSDVGEERRRLARLVKEVVAEEAMLVFSGAGDARRLFEREAQTKTE